MPTDNRTADAPPGSLYPAGSAFSVDDAINGLKHMADDHKCCEPFIAATIAKLEQLREAANTALWIRDRLQDHGSFGAGFAEWRDIEDAITSNAAMSDRADSAGRNVK